MLENLRDWIRKWRTRIAFWFKPTYFVFSSPQEALDMLPRRGGTLVLSGTFEVGREGLQVPDKDVRVIGGRFHVAPDSPGFKVDGTRGKHVIFNGCSFFGDGKGGSCFTLGNGDAEKP